MHHSRQPPCDTEPASQNTPSHQDAAPGRADSRANNNSMQSKPLSTLHTPYQTVLSMEVAVPSKTLCKWCHKLHHTHCTLQRRELPPCHHNSSSQPQQRPGSCANHRCTQVLHSQAPSSHTTLLAARNVLCRNKADWKASPAAP